MLILKDYRYKEYPVEVQAVRQQDLSSSEMRELLQRLASFFTPCTFTLDGDDIVAENRFGMTTRIPKGSWVIFEKGYIYAMSDMLFRDRFEIVPVDELVMPDLPAHRRWYTTMRPDFNRLILELQEKFEVQGGEDIWLPIQSMSIANDADERATVQTARRILEVVDNLDNQSFQTTLETRRKMGRVISFINSSNNRS